MKTQVLPRTNNLNLEALPPITAELEEYIKAKGIEKSQSKIIRYYGPFLWQKTNGVPTSSQYSTVATAIVTLFPALRGGRNGVVKSFYLEKYIHKY